MWAFRNGFDLWGVGASWTGNGNGFKLGGNGAGGDSKGTHYILWPGTATLRPLRNPTSEFVVQKNFLRLRTPSARLLSPR